MLVPAEQVWDETGDSLVYANRRFDQPQERLRADLARAALKISPLERCIAEARPATCPIAVEEAYEFLREGAWLLEEEGFGVLTPSWWDRAGPGGQLGLKLNLTRLVSSAREYWAAVGARV